MKVVGHVVSVLCLRTCASQGSLAEAKARPPSCPLANVIYRREVSLNAITITSLRAIRRRPWCELIAAASKSYFAHFLDLAVSGLFRHYGFAIIRFTCNEIEIHLLNMQYALSTRTTLCVKGYVKPDRMCGPVDYTVPWGSGSFQSANDSSLSERQGCALPRQQSSKLPPSCPCTTRRRGD